MLRPWLLMVVLPLAAAEPEMRKIPPAESLRHLAEDGAAGFATRSHFGRVPEELLDVIFVPRGTDDPDPETVEAARQRIAKLGDESYPEREQATEFLGEMGTAIRGLLEEAEDSDDPEIRLRAGKLLSRMAGQPALKDLDFGKVQRAIEKIVDGMKDDAVLQAFARDGIRRMGEPTAHDHEAWLLRPVFREVVKRGLAGAPELIETALKAPHAELVANAAAATSEATSSVGLNESYVAALRIHRPECLDALLDHALSIDADTVLAPRYREGLLAVVEAKSLPDATRLKAHRLLLIGFHEADSLRALLDAAQSGEEAVSALALSDPRLAGVPLAGAEKAAALIGHAAAGVREAAGIFLLTRPDEQALRSGFDFLPHLTEDGEKALKRILGSMRESKVLREELQRRVDRRGGDWEKAERLMLSLPGDPLLSPLQMPFGFR